MFEGRNVRILIGPPGTGKTYSLIQKVKEYLAMGIPPEEIAYCSFTTRAANEAISRAQQEFDLPRKRFMYFRTLHSLAFKLLQLNKNQVMRREHYKEFGEIIGMEFTNSYSNETERPTFIGDQGDLCLACYAYARARKIPIEQAWYEIEKPQIPPLSYVLEFADDLAKYKRKHDIYDFSDFLENCAKAINVKVFILDEAQDLTRQQWEFFDIVSRKATDIWIAGDDDQAIYNWAGADVRTFINLKGERTVLPVSHRLPKAIFDFSNSIIEQVSVRISKEWNPFNTLGNVLYLANLDNLKLQNGKSWLLLARYQHQLKQLRKMAYDQGVVFKDENRDLWSNQEAYVFAINRWKHFQQTKEISANDVVMISEFSTKIVEPRRISSMFSAHEFGDLISQDWEQVLDLLTHEQVSYVRALEANNEPLSGPGRVVISTIHAAKGGEADNVVILDGLTSDTYQSYLRDPDNEHRVFYVGCTRAKETLYIVPSNSPRRYFSY